MITQKPPHQNLPYLSLLPVVKCLHLFSLQLVVLTLSVILYLTQETLPVGPLLASLEEWDMKIIYSVRAIAPDDECLPNEEVVQGVFPGTRGYCEVDGEEIREGRCPKRSRGFTVEGMTP